LAKRSDDKNLALARSFFFVAQEKGEMRREPDMFNYQTDLCGKPEFRAFKY